MCEFSYALNLECVTSFSKLLLATTCSIQKYSSEHSVANVLFTLLFRFFFSCDLFLEYKQKEHFQFTIFNEYVGEISWILCGACCLQCNWGKLVFRTEPSSFKKICINSRSVYINFFLFDFASKINIKCPKHICKDGRLVIS